MDEILGSSLKFANLKCLGEEPQGFECIKPVNVIIGRNNSGKSTLLDPLQYLVNNKFEFPQEMRRAGREVTVDLSIDVSEGLAKRVFPENRHGGELGNLSNHWVFGKQTVGYRLTTRLHPRDDVLQGFEGKNGGSIESVFSRVGNNEDRRKKLLTDLAKGVRNPFQGLVLFQIRPERSITPEPNSDAFDVAGNGTGACRLIQKYLNKSDLPRELVREELLDRLNQIFGPDADFTEILTQQVAGGDEWEIYLTESSKGLIPLSQSGHGLQTIILVLVYTLLIPHHGNRDLSHCLFAFEELENNLHPALFRRLLKYIRDLTVTDGAIAFLTTHSHIAIDMFSRDEHASIVHVTHDGTEAKCRTVTTYVENSGILDDLDVRASDILQANGVIWVEGPSDRIYINHRINCRQMRE